MFNTLCYIGEKLNNERVLWGVGASVLLSHYNLVDKPNDIDILVGLNDIEKVDTILKSVGEKKGWERVDTYSTEYFYEYTINGIDVDVMAGLRIKHDNGMFIYIFDQGSIPHTIEMNGIQIPLTSLEDWYVIYQLIPNREKKVKIIEEYLISNGVKYPALLKRTLEADIPDEVRDKIKRMLRS